MKCLNEHTKIRGIRVFDTFYLVILIYIYIYYTYLLSVILFFTFFIFLYFINFDIIEKFFNVEY